MTGTVITRKGIALITKLLTSKQNLIFTRAAVGTGSTPQGYDPSGMIDLNQYKMDGEICDYFTEEDQATVVFQVSSTNVEEGFIITEAGLFAEDEDEGEILYAYLDLSDDPQYVYAKNSVVQKFAEIEFKTIVGAIENISVITSPGALVTKDVFKAEIEKLQTPEFNDSGEVEGITGFQDFLGSVTSKMNLFQFFRNLKAGMGYVLHMGKLVNNGLCNTPGQFALDAAYGKNLQDQITQLNADFEIKHLQASIDGAANQWIDTGLSITIPPGKRAALFWMIQLYSEAQPLGFQLRLNKTGATSSVCATYEFGTETTSFSPIFAANISDRVYYLYMKKQTAGKNPVAIYYITI